MKFVVSGTKPSEQERLILALQALALKTLRRLPPRAPPITHLSGRISIRTGIKADNACQQSAPKSSRYHRPQLQIRTQSSS